MNDMNYICSWEKCKTLMQELRMEYSLHNSCVTVCIVPSDESMVFYGVDNLLGFLEGYHLAKGSNNEKVVKNHHNQRDSKGRFKKKVKIARFYYGGEERAIEVMDNNYDYIAGVYVGTNEYRKFLRGKMQSEITITEQ